MSIRSEIGKLQQIVVHRPGPEHHHFTPENIHEWIPDDNGRMVRNPDYLLFDDLVDPGTMAREHENLSSIIASVAGSDHTFYFTDLLKDILDNPDTRSELAAECLETDEVSFPTHFPNASPDIIIDSSLDDAAETFLTGKHPSGQSVFSWPIPNLIFSRDIAAMVGNTLFLTWAKRNVRKREMILAKYVFMHHPNFKDLTTVDFHSNHPGHALEGGDIMVFDSKTLFVGLSERNSKESIDAFLPTAYSEGFETVFVIDLPKSRTVMHLDTIFTRISEKDVLIYPPLYSGTELKGYPISVYRAESGQLLSDVSPAQTSLESVFTEYGFSLNAIFCGGTDSVHQDREQWTDGANAFALDSGKIISYSRNTKTLEELKKVGYAILSDEEYLADPDTHISSDENWVISLASHELPRGRGGPRCLTLPLDRAN
ncbi:MAG: arginine deiminase family protein [Candidatus Marinimicrobia bacterium]|nr:arginine deiminase family protein [Candidatus Neomarinimicrobiota bacterium]